MAREIKGIGVHHSYSSFGTGEMIEFWHTTDKPVGNGWKSPGYHVVICNGYPNGQSRSDHDYDKKYDGKVDRIHSETKVSNGIKGANSQLLNVCMIGNFDEESPTVKQLKKLVDLLAFWCKKYKLDPHTKIFGHGEMQRKLGKETYVKTCPGTHVDMDRVRGWVSLTMKGNMPDFLVKGGKE